LDELLNQEENYHERQTQNRSDRADGGRKLLAHRRKRFSMALDVAREFWDKDYNAAFIDLLRENHHARSRLTSRMGAPVPSRSVTGRRCGDHEHLDRCSGRVGVVAKDWAKQLPGNASPTTSAMLFWLAQPGSLKGINWDDLAKPGIRSSWSTFMVAMAATPTLAAWGPAAGRALPMRKLPIRRQDVQTCPMLVGWP
jgi:ABC-type sulfate transport system substrate-binding protein